MESTNQSRVWEELRKRWVEGAPCPCFQCFLYSPQIMISSHEDLVSPSTWWVLHVRPADGDVTTSTAWRLLKPPLRPATIFIPRSAVTPRGSDRSFHGATPRFPTLKKRQRGGKAWRIGWQWVKHSSNHHYSLDSQTSDSGGWWWW